ncbi:MAG: FecR domain-containing protein [Prevotella sp.]|nr:FecR domain-containing protein [Prevotella sp.]
MQIQDLIIKSLFATLDEAERQQLDAWLQEADHATVYQRISSNIHDQDDVVKFLADIDVESALEEVHRKSRAKWLVLLRYAAAILVLVIDGAGIWYSQYTKVTPPEIPEAVQLAMQQSIQSGKQEAEVLGVRGERLRVGELGSGMKIRGERIESGAGKQEQDISLTSHPSPLTTENLSSLTKDQLLAAKRITTRHDKEFWLTLDDGTLVHLNYNTRLIYPEKFGRGDRNVILDGEAYFMVAKDKSRPFIVHTPNGDVKVYGTEFNVNTRAEVRGEKIRGEKIRGEKIRGERIESSTGDGQQDKSLTSHPSPLTSKNTTSVVLVKGSVSVTPTGGKETMLKPGQQATVNVQSSMPNGQWSTVNGQWSTANGQSSTVNGQWSTVNGQWSTVNVTNVDVEPYVAWNTGTFVFDDCPLEQLMNVLSRWYGYEAQFDKEETKQITFTGELDKYSSIDMVMNAINRVTGIRITMNKGKIIFSNN